MAPGPWPPSPQPPGPRPPGSWPPGSQPPGPRPPGPQPQVQPTDQVNDTSEVRFLPIQKIQYV